MLVVFVQLTEVTKKCSTFEKQCTEMKATVAELMQKLNVLKEKVSDDVSLGRT